MTINSQLVPTMTDKRKPLNNKYAMYTDFAENDYVLFDIAQLLNTTVISDATYTHKHMTFDDIFREIKIKTKGQCIKLRNFCRAVDEMLLV